MTFYNVYQNIMKKNKFLILCGGSGLYIESILLNYKIPNIPPDYELRKKLENKSIKSLQNLLQKIDNNVFDTDYHITKRRIIRSIEIHNKKNITSKAELKTRIQNYKVLGIKTNRDILLKIKIRLEERMNNGMIDEVKKLVDYGLSLDRLKYFGLEYKFIGEYIFNNISYDEMFPKLNIAINRFFQETNDIFLEEWKKEGLILSGLIAVI